MQSRAAFSDSRKLWRQKPLRGRKAVPRAARALPALARQSPPCSGAGPFFSVISGAAGRGSIGFRLCGSAAGWLSAPCLPAGAAPSALPAARPWPESCEAPPYHSLHGMTRQQGGWLPTRPSLKMQPARAGVLSGGGIPFSIAAKKPSWQAGWPPWGLDCTMRRNCRAKQIPLRFRRPFRHKKPPPFSGMAMPLYASSYSLFAPAARARCFLYACRQFLRSKTEGL